MTGQVIPSAMLVGDVTRQRFLDEPTLCNRFIGRVVVLFETGVFGYEFWPPIIILFSIWRIIIILLSS
jgi:hypothetical protein